MAQLMKVDNFNELGVKNPDHFLIVKVLSTWKRPMFNNPKLTYSVEMMLLDQQFGKFSIYDGKYSVSNAFNGTKLFFNSDKVKEIVSFRFLETSEEDSTSSFSSISNSIEFNMEKDFLISTDYSHSAEVDSVTKKKDLIVLGTIVFIQPKWFYPACNHCNRIVQRTDEGDEASYCCSNPVCIKEKRVINPYPRFKILFKVQDSAGTVDMTMFDSVAKQIIKKTASDFVVPLTFKVHSLLTYQ
ncbi:hypothetical protein SSX86_002038 [Deinandra increscens subsp. villosa]|uniref:Replication factor A C-terminal domain-containing protein n=1 Tax=Deinandra increscens subsp. villosa TaxID=3103831 RepID=A0AAP0DMU7_9ASTR